MISVPSRLDNRASRRKSSALSSIVRAASHGRTARFPRLDVSFNCAFAARRISLASVTPLGSLRLLTLHPVHRPTAKAGAPIRRIAPSISSTRPKAQKKKASSLIMSIVKTGYRPRIRPCSVARAGEGASWGMSPGAGGVAAGGVLPGGEGSLHGEPKPPPVSRRAVGRMMSQ